MESTDRKYQTSFRKEILAVLKESGNELCVPTVTAVMESDAAVAEDAQAAIKAISKRHKGIKAPKAVAPKSEPLKTISKTGDAYVDACFQIEFPEYFDGRNWLEIPEAKAITGPGAGAKVYLGFYGSP